MRCAFLPSCSACSGWPCPVSPSLPTPAVVYTCSDNGLPDKRLLRTGIYVNLLPEADALRLKQGLYVTGETALRALLEDLGE